MIVCCGEALIDFLPRKTAEGADTFQPFVGGSVLNVAVALGRLGAPAGFFCGLSDDFFGAMIRDALHASKVDTSLSIMSSRPTSPSPKPTIARITSSAARLPATLASAPRIPASAQVATVPAGGDCGNRQR